MQTKAGHMALNEIELATAEENRIYELSALCCELVEACKGLLAIALDCSEGNADKTDGIELASYIVLGQQALSKAEG